MEYTKPASAWRIPAWVIVAMLTVLLSLFARAEAADPGTGLFDPRMASSPGAKVFAENCAACHEGGFPRAPSRIILTNMTPRAIHDALTAGAMKEQGAALSEEQKVQVAEFLTNRKLAAADTAPPVKFCEGNHAVFDRKEPPVFTGWGFDPASTHTIPTKVAGLNRKNVGKLKLKWAFGVPDAARMRSQPALAGGAIYFGAHDNSVYALDRETGCVRWKFATNAEVRTGIVISPWQKGDTKARPLAYFGDIRGNAYAVDAFTGKQVWKVSVDEHPAAVVTGTPTLHGAMLYVPVSSLEEASAAAPGYACCTFRGSVLALDASTGEQKWRTWLVDEAKEQPASSGGLPVNGPSGVSVWNSPSIDIKRNQLYVDTSDNYSQPATELSDAILALDLTTGKIKWHYQALEGDAWNVACILPGKTNCPDDAGPDFDFGAGTVLAKGKDGRERVLAGQKSGIVYAIDPDTGKLDWQARVGRGSPAGGINFGMAAANGTVLAPVADMPDGQPVTFPRRPGLHALDIATGKPLWSVLTPDSCGALPPCVTGYSGSVSATPELAMAGADDGFVRIFDIRNGKLLWEYDTKPVIQTINGVEAHGGGISGGVTPVAYKGQLIVASGYGFGFKSPGNLLMVFEIK